MGNSLCIHEATVSDAGIIEELAKEIWEQHYTPIIGEAQVHYMLHNFQSRRAIENDIVNGCVYYIAFSDNIPCGYSAIKKDSGVFLSKLYVRQDFRGRGVARAMLSGAEENAARLGEKRIWLTCNKHNTASLCAYKHMGFAVIQAVETDIGGGFVMDDYILEKRLDTLSRANHCE